MAAIRCVSAAVAVAPTWMSLTSRCAGPRGRDGDPRSEPPRSVMIGSPPCSRLLRRRRWLRRSYGGRADRRHAAGLAGSSLRLRQRSKNHRRTSRAIRKVPRMATQPIVAKPGSRDRPGRSGSKREKGWGRSALQGPPAHMFERGERVPRPAPVDVGANERPHDRDEETETQERTSRLVPCHRDAIAMHTQACRPMHEQSAREILRTRRAWASDQLLHRRWEGGGFMPSMEPGVTG